MFQLRKMVFASFCFQKNLLLCFTLSPRVNKDTIVIDAFIFVIIILLWKNICASQKSSNHRNYAIQKFHSAFSREKKEGTFALLDITIMNQTLWTLFYKTRTFMTQKLFRTLI